MSSDAVMFYRNAYQKMLNYRDSLANDIEEVVGTKSRDYYQGHMDGIEYCLSILKSTHMILDMDDDF